MKPESPSKASFPQLAGAAAALAMSVNSAKDGTFTVTDVPDDNVEYMIQKEGYLIAEHVDMSPAQEEYAVTLKSLVRVVGLVVDAETGKPLEKFSFMPGTDFDDGRAPDWHAFEKKMITTGKYATNFRQENFKYRIRVEANGYMPGESRLIKPYDPDQGEITLDFKLHKAPNLAGIVEGLDKQPLADAEVYLVRGRMSIDRKVTYVDNADRESVKTDATGRFEFPPEIEAFCLVAVHEDGLGMVTEKQFAASRKITIQPWEKQKELLQIIPRPAPGQMADFSVRFRDSLTARHPGPTADQSTDPETVLSRLQPTPFLPPSFSWWKLAIFGTSQPASASLPFGL